MSAETAKRNAALAALEFVEDGMTVGLGTGSTAKQLVDLLGDRVAAGLDIRGVPTSEATAAQARACGIPLPPFSDIDRIHVTIDGADEADAKGRLIKGGGGALLREKIIAGFSDRMVVIADASKRVATLGAFPLPVEVTPFAEELTVRRLQGVLVQSGAQNAVASLRRANGAPFVTDGGNHIFDCALGRIEEPEGLAAALADIPGVVEHGLFLGLASTLIFGTETGADRIDL